MNGHAVPRTHQLMSASVSSTANHIAWARLAWRDGDAASSDFPLSAEALFVAGAEVEILAGGTRPDLLFKGLVVRQQLKVRAGSAPQFIVECRHAATKMSLKRHSATYLDMSDGDVVRQLFQAAGLSITVADMPLTHDHLVQYDTTDWDFAVTRTEVHGQLLLTRGETIETRSPSASAPPVATLQFGATLIEFDAEIDAREQTQGVQTLTWSPADQSVHTLDGNPANFTSPGNQSADTLAAALDMDVLELRHTLLPDEEATAAASARLSRARLNQVCGRALCLGLGQVLPGDVVTLAGVGARFNGQALVTGVRHEMDTLQGWRTHLQFGGVPEDPARRMRLETRRTTSLLAPVPGLQIGIVTDNEDPQGEFRVRVRLPLVDPASDGVWARVATVDAGNDRGLMLRAEIGDEVVVGFFDEDPRAAVILGMLHSSAKAAPLPPGNDNHEKLFKSRSGIRIHIDDDKTILTVTTPAGQQIVLDDDQGSVLLEDKNGNRLLMDSSGITLESCDALTVQTAGNASLDVGGSGEVKTATGLGIAAGTQLKLEGSAGAELTSPAITQVKGSLVKIN